MYATFANAGIFARIAEVSRIAEAQEIAVQMETLKRLAQGNDRISVSIIERVVEVDKQIFVTHNNS